jgi:prophage antirepressor-like protein
MTTQLIPFSFETFTIRVVMQDDQPWWVAADVCAALEIGNPSDAIKRLDDDERTLVSIEGASNGLQVNAVNESGLYSLILGSRKPEAKMFKRWITHDVIPSIRQTGSYTVPNAKPTIRDERELQLLARDTMRTLKVFGIVGNAAVLSTDNYCRAIVGRSLLEPLGATHLLADERGRTYTPTELGKMCNPPLSAVKLNLAIEQAGLQKRDMGEWMPSDKAAGLCEWLDTGKRHSNGTPVKQLKWFKMVLDRLLSGGMKEAA